jgi:tetratricopeptide (TPR) repeat protein
VEHDILRLSYFYHADCAFLLGDHPRAIDLYEKAAGRFATDPSVMHALVQLVNCYHALGDRPRAAAAHRRALARLQQLPESAFESPAALMSREAWERWLSRDPVGVALGGET